MSHSPLFLRVVLCYVVLFDGVASAKPKTTTPTRNEVRALLRRNPANASIRVSHIIADKTAAERFVVLFVLPSKDCSQSSDEEAGDTSATCSPTTWPHVALIHRAADGTLAVDGTRELPMKNTPWEIVQPFRWGIAKVQDYDKDGKSELLVIYGYDGPMAPAVGNVYYRELSFVNLDPQLSVALHITLDEFPEATVFPLITSKWRFASGSSDIVITRRVGDYDDKLLDRQYREEVVTYRYQAQSDTWQAPGLAP